MSSGQEHRFLGSGVEAPGNEFSALSSQGDSGFMGLETFDNPGCDYVEYNSDEVTLKCPVTGHPDFYVVKIAMKQPVKCIESKSLKLYFSMLHKESMRREEEGGMFCESLAVFLRAVVADATETPEERVLIELTQKARGGISIKAVA